MTTEHVDRVEDGIAIIGMACRVPGASTVDGYWANLCDGIESIKHLSDDELDPSVPVELRKDPNYVRARGILNDIEGFDAKFFGLSSLEAEVMDPQQRIMLELAWGALEHSGHNPDKYSGLIGLFAGMGNNTYYSSNLSSRPDIIRSAGEMQVMVANEKDYLATRVSYLLNLKGPSVSMNTACSTSLVTVCSAYDSLLNYQCDMALAGGITVRVPQNLGYLWQEVMIFSKDGHCRPFDAGATGTVASNGGGLVVLKRLDDALADRDTVYAVIRGTGLNNDGSGKMSFMAPSVDGQARAVAMALSNAGFEPGDISYVEAHGTGTAIGDPIEVEALTKVFGKRREIPDRYALGSAKSNLGHLDAGAGVAGLIKTVLALHHEKLPPTVHFAEPNPEIDFANSVFYVNNQLVDWRRSETPRRAGVSSFGVGGTNAHVVLEEGPLPAANRPDAGKPQAVLLSAKSATALDAVAGGLAQHVSQNPNVDLGELSRTLAVGRKAFRHRRVVLCNGAGELVEKLSAPATARSYKSAKVGRHSPEVAFMFPGQGAQYVNMGAALYSDSSVFRNNVDLCAEQLQPSVGIDIRNILYPTEPETERASEKLRRTRFNQPAVFTIEYALAKTWESWGITPSAMIGHSLGEYVAACIAGVFSLEDGLAIVATRGRLMQSVPEGAMLIVRMPVGEVKARMPAGISLSAVNSPNLCVVSGPIALIDGFRQTLDAGKVPCRNLKTSHAFHSDMMDPVMEPFNEAVKKVRLSAPKIPFVSTATGDWITDQQATDPDYWALHLRNTVQFSDGIVTLLENENRVLLEVGPGATTTHLAKDHIPHNSRQYAISSLGNASESSGERSAIAGAAGDLWLAGVELDWDEFCFHGKARNIALPTYPFERVRHWVDPDESKDDARCVSSVRPAPRVQPKLADLSAHEGNEPHVLESAYVEGLTGNEQLLLGIWKDVLPHVGEIGVDEDFFELGGHSLLAVPLFAGIVERTGVDLPLSTLFEAPTVRQMAGVLGQHTSEGEEAHQTISTKADASLEKQLREQFSEGGQWPSLVCLNSGGDLPPFFCVHGIGGNVLNYSRFVADLGEQQPIYGLQAQGLDGKTQPLRSIESMAARYVKEVREVQPHGPYYLSGGSMGGLIALEMAHQMTLVGDSVEFLGMFDTQGPNSCSGCDQTYEGSARARELVRSAAERLSPDGDSGVGIARFVAGKVYGRLHRYVRYARCSLLLMLKAKVPHKDRYWFLQQVNQKAINAYRPQSYRGRITMFRARPSEIAQSYDPQHGWGGVAAGGVEVVEIPGEHFSFVEEPMLGTHLRAALLAAQKTSSLR